MRRDYRIDFEPLSRFVRGLTDKSVVRVGIMGEKVSRRPEPGTQTPTNAEVGALHEFGSPGRVPQRSFLRMPLRMKSKAILAQMAIGGEKLLRDGKMKLLLKNLGLACENAVDDAFASGGFGKWAALKPMTVKRKGSSAILIDTRQLRASIASKVVER